VPPLPVAARPQRSLCPAASSTQEWSGVIPSTPCRCHSSSETKAGTHAAPSCVSRMGTPTLRQSSVHGRALQSDLNHRRDRDMLLAAASVHASAMRRASVSRPSRQTPGSDERRLSGRTARRLALPGGAEAATRPRRPREMTASDVRSSIRARRSCPCSARRCSTDRAAMVPATSVAAPGHHRRALL
jgi:hypothetical protein